MIKTLMRLLRRALGRTEQRHHDREQMRRIRALVIGAREARLRELAAIEGLTISELDDVLTMLAHTYPLTLDDAILLVERHGLARTHHQLESTNHE